jgi:hypothetical protein
MSLTDAERGEISRRHQLRAQGADVSFLHRRKPKLSFGAMLFQSTIQTNAATERWRKFTPEERKRYRPDYERLWQSLDRLQAEIEAYIGCKLEDLFGRKQTMFRRRI